MCTFLEHADFLEHQIWLYRNISQSFKILQQHILKRLKSTTLPS